jgi:hypothetical protein
MRPLSLLSSRAAAAGAAAPSLNSESPRERFCALLSEAGVGIDDRIMATIARHGSLSSRVLLVASTSEAVDLYEEASRVPRTETRAFVKRQCGVVIDGIMPVLGASSALFFYAFERYVPRVLKVPASGHAAGRECAMWLDVKDCVPEGVFLVPVELLPLTPASVHVVHISPVDVDRSLLKSGILMPAYAATLGMVPLPADAIYAARIIRRVEPSLRFLNSHAWLHGDVKPSNIFLDSCGEPWLGDYGSSVRLIDIKSSFKGGTTAFQCAEVDFAREPLRFDLVGLATSVLVLLGLLDVAKAPFPGWPLAALTAAVGRVADGGLRLQIEVLIMPRDD